MKDITISVPQEMSAIPLRDYQKYMEIIKQNEGEESNSDFVNLKAIEIFCHTDLKEAYKIPFKSFSGIIKHLTVILSEKTPLVKTFTLTDPKGTEIEFGFIPKLDDISMGEFVDLESFMGDWKQMHKALAVLYRPVKFKHGELYLIDDYEGSEKYSENMKDTPLNVALGAMLFFYDLGTDLLKHTMSCLGKRVSKDTDLQTLLEESGGGINRFTHLLKEISQGLEQLKDYQSLSV